MSFEKYRFISEWFDPTVKVKRKFMLSFYPVDGSVDMVDLGSKKLFLRRIKCDTININDLFVGSVVNVLSRQLYIVGFGDQSTADKFSKDLESSIFIINDSGFSDLGNIIAVLEDNDIFINRGKMIDTNRSGFSASSLSPSLGKRFLIFEARGEDSKNIVRKLIDPEAPSQKLLKANLGSLSSHCLVPDESAVETEIKIFFPASKEIHCNTVVFTDSTCCIIKPHAVKGRMTGKIIQNIIDAGFTISALEVISFNLTTASEFLEVYKGVMSEYQDMVNHFISGPCIALEITKTTDKDVFVDFRTFVGPHDPEIAKRCRPGTLRASFGKDKIKNAIHCTDLPEDTSIELDYIFRIMPA